VTENRTQKNFTTFPRYFPPI